jgi:hypothetical protein
MVAEIADGLGLTRGEHMIVKRFDTAAAREQTGEAAPWEVMLHSPQHCDCKWCATARRYATYTVVDEETDVRRFAEALAAQTLNALRAGQPLARVTAEVMKIMRTIPYRSKER